jgi:hypothetical protein
LAIFCELAADATFRSENNIDVISYKAESDLSELLAFMIRLALRLNFDLTFAKLFTIGRIIYAI